MRGRQLILIVLLSLLVVSFATHAAAQGFFPLGGWPIPTTPPSPPATPVGPPSPSMMPPAAPPAGNTYMGTGGISEYGGTMSGSTVLSTTGTDPMGGPAMAMPESPLSVAPYAPVVTQTDEILRGTYPSGSVGTSRVAGSYGGVAVASGGTRPLMPTPGGLPDTVPLPGLGSTMAPGGASGPETAVPSTGKR